MKEKPSTKYTLYLGTDDEDLMLNIGFRYSQKELTFTVFDRFNSSILFHHDINIEDFVRELSIFPPEFVPFGLDRQKTFNMSLNEDKILEQIKQLDSDGKLMRVCKLLRTLGYDKLGRYIAEDWYLPMSEYTENGAGAGTGLSRKSSFNFF